MHPPWFTLFGPKLSGLLGKVPEQPERFYTTLPTSLFNPLNEGWGINQRKMKAILLSLALVGAALNSSAQSHGLPNDGFIPGIGELVSTNPIKIICWGWDGRCAEFSRGLVTRGPEPEARVFDKDKKVISQFSYVSGTVTSGKDKGVDYKKVDFTGTKIIP